MTGAADLHESAHAARVLRALHARIAAAGGWLPFDEYMQFVLYAPGLGYYSAGAHKLGAGGDFTTAPEISPLFGQCVAQHCREVLDALGGGEILEIGAGSGRLAFDVLVAMEASGLRPARYRMLEVSADLRQRQQQLLSTLPASLQSLVEWIDVPPTESWRGALIANEVLDALPVRRFVRRTGEWQELGVVVDAAGALDWQAHSADGTVRAAVRALALPDLPEGYESEICLQLAPWLREVTAALHSGVALFVDYGLPRREYYSASRLRGTLRCHYRQRAHEDPFAHPGLEDVTAWVDFTRVAEAAGTCGLDMLGYTTHAGALLGWGIEALIAAAPDESTRLRRAGEARQLLLPTAMGESFKCMALGRDFTAPLRAFSVRDLGERL
jgi:SAM-dependent MidA family methyltransferase